MKRLSLFLVACFVGTLIAACAMTGSSTATPMQQYVTTATNATQLVDQVTLAADAAVKANLLKGADAQNTLQAIKVAQAGLAIAASQASTDPAAAVNKVTLALAALAATQTYLATLGAPK